MRKKNISRSQFLNTKFNNINLINKPTYTFIKLYFNTDINDCYVIFKNVLSIPIFVIFFQNFRKYY